MGNRSARLAAVTNIKDEALAFAVCVHTFFEDTKLYFEEVEQEVKPEVITPVEIG